MADIYLVRHAQSYNNALGESKRQADPPLTDLGKQQAARLIESLESLPADHYFVSGFRRALETAAPFAAKHQHPFCIWRAIHEVGGCYEGRTGETKRAVPGMTPSDILSEFSWAAPEAGWTDGGWNSLTAHETVKDAMPRVEKVAQTLLRDYAATDKRILLVTHGEFISLLIARLTGQGDPFFVRPRSIYNTAVSHLKLSPSSCQLHEFNRVCHLSRFELTS